MPVAIRLKESISEASIKSLLLWPDAGATALAKRDAPELSDNIMSFKDVIKSDNNDYTNHLLVAVSPQHYDYEDFENLCNKSDSRIIMLNGKLEDSDVGIGSVARERRKSFIRKWINIYWCKISCCL